MSASSRNVLANSRNSSVLNDVWRHANPIWRAAGTPRREREISVPCVTWASTASRGMRATPTPAATICTIVSKLLASNCARDRLSLVVQTSSV